MTDEALEHWPRPHFLPLPLHAFFFFIVYGTFDEAFPQFPPEEYRSLGLPEGLELTFHALQDRPELRDNFQQGAGWDQFCIAAPRAVEAMQDSSACLVLRGDLPDAATLDSLRDCIGLIMFLLDQGGSSVCDVLTGQWYSSLDWRLHVFEEGPNASQALVTFLSIEQPDGRLHLYTRGLRRFARPDLSIRDVIAADESSRLAIVQHLAASLIAGGSVPDRQRLRFPELGVNVSCRWQGSLDDPVFYNFWLELEVVAET